LAASEVEFGSSIDLDRLPIETPSDFSGTLDCSMCVYVTSAIDISQPQSKQEDESDDEVEEKIDSAYLNNKIVTGAKTFKFAPQSNRLLNFTLFDGKNKFTAMEYETIGTIRDFKTPGIILALKPPIQVRKGMFLLRNANVEVLH